MGDNLDNKISELKRKIIKAEQLCEVFLLYFDEVLGHIPILVSPDGILKNNNYPDARIGEFLV